MVFKSKPFQTTLEHVGEIDVFDFILTFYNFFLTELIVKIPLWNLKKTQKQEHVLLKIKLF